MKINQREQLLGVLAAAAVGLLVLNQWVATPLTAHWQQQAKRTRELRGLIHDGAVTLRRERGIRDQWAGIRTNTLPGSASAAENVALKAFERWSRESGVNLTSIKPQWRQEAEEYRTLECRAEAAGNLGALARFLYKIEEDNLAFRVESIQFTARDNQGQQLGLSLQLSGLLLNPQGP